jgi:methyl-accepting chemotaxis protein
MSDNGLHVAQSGAEAVQRLIDNMHSMATSTEEISKITSVIEEIAFQTNLLALNAAVEAARAGEQGKGFAVVADAVRNLAQRSQTSAKEIGDLISKTVELAENGKGNADKSYEHIQSIVESVSKFSEISKSILMASREQKSGIDQISSAVSSLDSDAQSNAAIASELSETAVSLEGQSSVISDNMNALQYAIDGEGNHSPSHQTGPKSFHNAEDEADQYYDHHEDAS